HPGWLTGRGALAGAAEDRYRTWPSAWRCAESRVREVAGRPQRPGRGSSRARPDSGSTDGMTSDPTTISKAVPVSVNGVTADQPVTQVSADRSIPARPSSGTAVIGQTGTRRNPSHPAKEGDGRNEQMGNCSNRGGDRT